MKINLIVPMAGRGSRFGRDVYLRPKPLIDLHGRPFFWWAIESVRRPIEDINLVCVVLKEHIVEYSIDSEIKKYYPHSKIISIPNVTSGSLQTAMIAVDFIDNNLPIVINDCDHAFFSSSFFETIKLFEKQEIDAVLCHFISASPEYSYAVYDQHQHLIETREKEVISDLAIAGAYIFKSKDTLLKNYDEYVNNCNYLELFVSGLFNIFTKNSLLVSPLLLNDHVSFGTPHEYKLAVEKFPFVDWCER